MFEDTNQTNEELFPEELFSEEQEDFTQDDTSETPTDADAVSDDADASGNVESGEGDATPADTPQTFKVSFLGEEREMTLDELKTLAQKGLNYDHVAGQRDKLKSESAILDDYARQSGMTREEYMNYLADSLENITKNSEISRLRERYPDADDELLSEMAEQGIKLRARDEEHQARVDRESEDEARRAPWKDFIREFPDVDIKSLPQEFFDRVGEGKSPTELYLRDKVKKLEEQAAAEEKNRENASRAVGSARGDGEREKGDPFLEGFMGG